ncbi:MAG: alpha/beta hydrolase [Burkholderiales bacterium]|nr:alpha/beta hydrolase [Burkholderiales bacterium]
MTQVISLADIDIHIDGDGDETIVMVHGWPDTYRLWDAQVAALKGRYRCVRFTLPGFDAAKARRAHSLDEVIGFLKQVVEQVCPGGKAILMLHDWGCVFGYQFYVRHPQLVSRIVGVDIGDPVSWRQSLARREMAMAFSYQFWLALAWMVGGRAGDWMTRFMARQARCPSDPAPMNSCMDYPYYLVIFGGAESYRHKALRFDPACPMLFVYGRRKPLTFHSSAWADALQKREGNQVVPFDTGHWVMLEQPERFNQVVGDWLSTASPF